MPFSLSSIIDEALARHKFSLYRPWTSSHFQQLFIEGRGDQNILKLRKFLDNLVSNLFKVYCVHVTLQKDRKEDTMDKSTKRGNKANKKLHRAIGTLLDKFFNVLHKQSFYIAFLQLSAIETPPDMHLEEFDIIDEKSILLIF